MILVTGATGFLGSEVVRQLTLQSIPVVGLKRPSSKIPYSLQNLNVTWREAELLNYFALEEALEGITQVYHCAARISFDPGEKKAMINANCQITANIANLCLEKNIRLLHVSSVAAIGDAKNGSPINEKDHWLYSARQSGYSTSKYESEMEVWRAMAEGLNAVIVNPSIIIGKNCGVQGSSALFYTVKNGLKFYPSGTCGLVDVEDVATTMIRLMESEIAEERFIVNAENWSYRDLFTEIATELGQKPPTLHARPWMLRLAANAVSLVSAFKNQRFGLTTETARSASQTRIYSNTKIIEAIGIQFKPIRQSIKEICQTLK